MRLLKQELVAQQARNGARYWQYIYGRSVALVQEKCEERWSFKCFEGDDMSFRLALPCLYRVVLSYLETDK
jgi:hypothetical protein